MNRRVVSLQALAALMVMGLSPAWGWTVKQEPLAPVTRSDYNEGDFWLVRGEQAVAYHGMCDAWIYNRAMLWLGKVEGVDGALVCYSGQSPLLLTQCFLSDRAWGDDLKRRFADPPAANRILPIVHNLPQTPEAQDAQRVSMRARGFGGFTCNVSFNQYLEDDEAWASFLRGIREAKQDGMALWLYDERGYPSGNAGGLTMRDHPEWEARGIYAAEAATSGDEVSLTVPPGTLVRAGAFPAAAEGIDLAGALDLSDHVAEGKLTWRPDTGVWRALVLTEDRLYENTHAAVSLADKLPYVNLLMPEPTARFIELTHAEYARRLDSKIGDWFEATFTDEPSLMSLFMRPQSFRVVPWAPNLEAEFAARRGYALEPLLPALFMDAGPQTARTRYDFWQTIGDLVSENFFGQIQSFCRTQGIPSGGHLLMEESFLSHVPLYGNFFQCLRRLDAPAMDCLTSIPGEVPWYVARIIGSVADLEGRTLTMSETSDHSQRWRGPDDKRPTQEVTEAQIRGTFNRQMAFGINTITSYYSFKGLTDEALNRLNEWAGRCSTLLRGGYEATSIALLYPVESAWVHFTPSTLWNEDTTLAARLIEAAFRSASQQLFLAGRDFTYVDALALTQAKTEDGALCVRDMAWRVVVLPRTDTLPKAAWDNLYAFWKKGGAVIALGALPENSERDFPSAGVQAMARKMFGESGAYVCNPNGGVGVYLGPGSEMLFPQVIESLLDRDVRIEGPGAAVHVTRRNIDGHEVFFVFNDSPEDWRGSVIFAGNGPGEQWNPASGQVSACERSVTLNLEPYGAQLFRFTDTPMPARVDLVARQAPRLQYSPMPPVSPTAGHGEFLTAELIPDPEFSAEAKPAWRASGTVAKDGEDTFFFVCFDYPQPVDLSEATGLSAEVWRPAGQRCRKPVLVMVTDRRGAVFMADTHQSMGDEGSVRCVVPLSAFEATSWGTQGTGSCDWSAITSVKIGWGGYRSSAGDQIAFATRPPETARIVFE